MRSGAGSGECLLLLGSQGRVGAATHDPLGVGAGLTAGVDRGEHQPVAAVVDDGGAEREPPTHVAEGVVAHDRDVSQRLRDVGAQGGEVAGADRTLPFEQTQLAAHPGEDDDDEQGHQQREAGHGERGHGEGLGVGHPVSVLGRRGYSRRDMDFDLATMAIVFGAIFLVELPDKTFIATLVLATRFRPLYVWIGVCLAFAVQTIVAVTVGGLLAQLPKRPVEVFAAVLFLVGGVILIRGAGQADEEEAETEEEFSHKGAATAVGLRAVGVSFGVLFLAEWGDLSQLLTASMVLQFKEPVSVFIGAFLALATVSALAAVLGRALLARVRLATIRRIGGGVCLLLAALTVLQVFEVISI